jgi:hypothetical protein
MLQRPTRLTSISAIELGAIAIILVVLLATPWRHADAQGVMSPPACQCSAPTAIPGISTTIVHCICGGMACVISEHTGSGKNGNRLQCVK